MKHYIFILFAGLFFTASALVAGEAPPLPNPDVMSKEYWDLWNDSVQAEIDKRIEQHRKADAVVVLTDVKPGTEVKIEQISHEFLFGANIFNFNQLGSKKLDDKYKAVFGELWNSATIPFYWSAFEPEKGKLRFETCPEDNPEFWAKVFAEKRDPHKERFWRRPATDQIVEFCEQKGLFRHGHPLVTSGFHPDQWLPRKTAEDMPEVERQIERRMTQIAKHYKGRINRWDVSNDWAQNMEKPGFLMPDKMQLKAFKLAEKLFPKDVIFSINCSFHKSYIPLVQDLLKQGARIDVVGIHMHLMSENRAIAKGAKIQTPEMNQERLTTADKTGLPIHMSEVTVASPDGTPEGWQIQANITRNLYRYWFSWKSIPAITWWNLVDQCGYKGEPVNSGLFTRQMEKKPAYYALERLINHEWKTNIVQKADKENMSIPFRGFKGKYKVSWTDKDGNIKTTEIVVK